MAGPKLTQVALLSKNSKVTLKINDAFTSEKTYIFYSGLADGQKYTYYNSKHMHTHSVDGQRAPVARAFGLSNPEMNEELCMKIVCKSFFARLGHYPCLSGITSSVYKVPMQMLWYESVNPKCTM